MAALELEIGRVLTRRGLTLVTAESCTGGLIGHRITNVAGSSAYYLGGIIAYSNEAKLALLRVRAETLRDFGAVSGETAREMAEGARVCFDAGIALAVTGIAGPGGGSAEKPVGLVYMAVAGGDGTRSERAHYSGDRESIKRATAERALALALEYLG